MGKCGNLLKFFCFYFGLICEKTFAGLSTIIIVIRKRYVFIFHLEANYAKINCKNKIYVNK